MRTSRDEWRRLIAGWRASGLSCRQYADQAGVNPNTLAWWKWKLSAGGERFEAALLPFVEVTQPAAASVDLAGQRAGIGLSIGDISVSVAVGFDEATLLRLLDVLETRL